MKTRYLNFRSTSISTDILPACLHELSHGSIIITPTDTIYGFLGNYDHKESRIALIRLKKRPLDKPFIVLVKSVEAMYRFAKDPIPKWLLSYIPGPITIIVTNRESERYQEPTLAIRVPSHPWMNALLNGFEHPLLSTSANISGQPYDGSFETIKTVFKGKVPLMVDGGDISAPPSTLLDCTVNPVKVLRDMNSFADRVYQEKGISLNKPS